MFHGLLVVAGSYVRSVSWLGRTEVFAERVEQQKAQYQYQQEQADGSFQDPSRQVAQSKDAVLSTVFAITTVVWLNFWSAIFAKKEICF